MTSGIQSLLESIDAGEVTPANALSYIERAGGGELVILEVVRALAASSGGVDPLSILASEGEAEYGEINNKLMTPLRTAQAIAAQAGAASSIATARVAYVESSGNNATAQIGDPSKPYALVDAAKSAAISLGGNVTLKLGVGAFTSSATSWPANIAISGSGVKQTTLNLECTGSLAHYQINGNLDLDLTLDVSPAGQGSVSEGQTGTLGSSGLEVKLFQIYGRVTTRGGDGGPGGSGIPAMGEDPELPAGNGGAGGAGGMIHAVSCILEHCRSLGGSGGEGGTLGGGSPGSSGSAGDNGNVTLTKCIVGDVVHNQLEAACTAFADDKTSVLTNDFGGNAMLVPFQGAF